MDADEQELERPSDGGSSVAWAHMGMQGGGRVLTISSERVEPPTAAGEDEPHTYVGLSLSAVGVSVVHSGVEELLSFGLIETIADAAPTSGQ